mmetsp:Transcript_74942/g.124942  ORF Transcript_74942/g.124942 Transcript_74942/m.124942 type:complete len:196 (-) Transcript_74942:59-646(-)|eukprot:CAMPEP_0119322770 /NCGR_PEP_ID=MMETSP1333-20130426/59128_1 /TAXON_ID=418940 /ORGANISM="Scyphosphaera apsteinii, Strain RCC1455" /LENGTH=195 /DNA_ID=CAMNT_0007330079 /DNA_START=77 /DNA_END=664 /DNA_ORIENTATION=+
MVFPCTLDSNVCLPPVDDIAQWRNKLALTQRSPLTRLPTWSVEPIRFHKSTPMTLGPPDPVCPYRMPPTRDWTMPRPRTSGSNSNTSQRSSSDMESRPRTSASKSSVSLRSSSSVGSLGMASISSTASSSQRKRLLKARQAELKAQLTHVENLLDTCSQTRSSASDISGSEHADQCPVVAQKTYAPLHGCPNNQN